MSRLTKPSIRRATPTLLVLLLFIISSIPGCNGVSGRANNSPNLGAPSPTPAPATPPPTPLPPPPPTPAPPPTSQSGAPPARFVFALDASQVGNPSIAVFAFNNSTGALSQISGSPFSIEPHPDVETMAATPTTGFVYTADWFDHVIQVFRADPNTGALTQTVTVSTPELQLPLRMLVDPAGKFLFVDDLNGLQVGVYAIANDGSLTPVPGSPFKTTQPLTQITIDSAGKLLYASGDNMVFGFTITADGALTPVPGSGIAVRSPFITPGKGPTNVGVAVDPAGKFLFVGDTISQNTWVYAIASDGSLTLVPGSPFTTPGNAGVDVVSPDGKFLFEGGGAVAGVSQIHSDGTLTTVPGSPFPNGPFNNGGAPVNALVTDPQGKFLLLADTENSEITVFSVDPNSGALTNVSGSPFMVAAQPIGGGSPSTIVVTH